MASIVLKTMCGCASVREVNELREIYQCGLFPHDLLARARNGEDIGDVMIPTRTFRRTGIVNNGHVEYHEVPEGGD